MKFLIPKSRLLNLPFTFYALQVHKTRSDTHKRYWISTSSKQEFLLPPLPVQRAIVAKTEELFSSLDSGIADLKKAQEQLKVYRQAVLKKAFEGEFTKEWRIKQQDLPKTEDLLETVFIERESYYEENLRNWKAALQDYEKKPSGRKKPRKPRKLAEVPGLSLKELEALPTLPRNWGWTKLGNISSVFVGSTPSRSKKEYWENGNIPWVSSGEVSFNKIFDTTEKITQKGLDNASTIVHPPSTVLLAMIGEGKTRGQAAILQIPACHNQNTAAIQINQKILLPEFLFYYLFMQYEKNRRVGSGNNQKALNQGRIMNFDFPLTSVKEQALIVKEIESRISVCDQTERSIEENLQKVTALQQSILKKAFDGKLLSEEEIEKCKKEKDYESADVLLKRIKEEKMKSA
ncbi:restriction endonuclease subunit S [Autumnicola psychrophila]